MWNAKLFCSFEMTTLHSSDNLFLLQYLRLSKEQRPLNFEELSLKWKSTMPYQLGSVAESMRYSMSDLMKVARPTKMYIWRLFLYSLIDCSCSSESFQANDLACLSNELQEENLNTALQRVFESYFQAIDEMDLEGLSLDFQYNTFILLGLWCGRLVTDRNLESLLTDLLLVVSPFESASQIPSTGRILHSFNRFWSHLLECSDARADIAFSNSLYVRIFKAITGTSMLRTLSAKLLQFACGTFGSNELPLLAEYYPRILFICAYLLRGVSIPEEKSTMLCNQLRAKYHDLSIHIAAYSIDDIQRLSSELILLVLGTVSDWRDGVIGGFASVSEILEDLAQVMHTNFV